MQPEDVFMFCLDFIDRSPDAIYIPLTTVGEKIGKIKYLQQYGKDVDIINIDGEQNSTASGVSQEWLMCVLDWIYRLDEEELHFHYYYYTPRTVYGDKPREWLLDNIKNLNFFHGQPIRIASSLTIHKIDMKKEKL